MTTTMTERLWSGLGPTVRELEDEGSVWHVPVELRELYLEEARAMDRAKVNEIERLASGGLDGRQTIRSSWLLGLRAEARAAAGLDPIPLDKLGNYRVGQGWPVELSSSDGITGWALHVTALEAAVQVAHTRELQAALKVSVGSAKCPACSVPVTGPASDLCSSCKLVAEVVRLDRARELGRERV